MMLSITIGNKTGTVVYLDRDWHPTEPDVASLAKVRFDDGSVSFYRVSPSSLRAFEFNPQQARDKEGKWTDGPSAAFRQEVGTTSTEMRAEPLPQSLKEAEERIRREPNEHAFLVKDGKVTAYFGNDKKDQVELPKDRDYKDTIFTHNHPMGSAFSMNDVATASYHNMAEMRAVTSEGTYSIKRLGVEWPDRNYLLDKAAPASFQVEVEFKNRMRNHLMTIDEANHDHWKTVWNRVVDNVKQDFTSSSHLSFSFEPKS